ncbi:hypothetical protein GA0074692_6870 [Micromonospora pallida]|uniref:Uncharacterized protein n=1 Tax=Micromonospora pallida TaxID=145854 RepID=A0A1C6TPD2_9ACTN|nr:hypothetical protein [Micromonospora pallida]SCL16359.1 hypothetical protein GA0074692_0011 [Micromonospora pallida]SCL43415.1 hypothetical protein GA0074692_6870 [Micromonospora pallida]
MATIKAPNREYNGRIGDVVFRDGVAETDDQAVIQYCRGAGYEVDGTTDSPVEGTPEPADPRDVTEEQLGTRLRDAAVDPRETDFLPPVNAGQANPHGPDVVAPGIHAVAGPGPIVPGPVGRLERTEDGGQVVITDTEEQQRRETTAAEQVFLERRDVPEVTAELGAEVGQPAGDRTPEPPAGNASQETWADWVIATRPDLDEAEVRAMKRDDLRATYGPTAE